jgi:primosomal protein N' (replication factor Y)
MARESEQLGHPDANGEQASLFPTGKGTARPRAANARGYVRVAVERAIQSVRGGPGRQSAGKAGDKAGDATKSERGGGGLTYAWIDSEPARVGERVMVPLGRAGKLAPGIVVRVGGAELLDGFDPARVKAVDSREGVALPPDLVELAGWLAERCYCSLGVALGAMMPAAVKKGTGRKKVEMVTRVAGASVPAVGKARKAPKGIAGGEAIKRDAAEGDVASSGDGAAPVRLSRAARTAWDRIAAMDPSKFPMPIKQLARLVELGTVAPLRALVAAGVLHVHDELHVRASVDALDVGSRREDDAHDATDGDPAAIDSSADSPTSLSVQSTSAPVLAPTLTDEQRRAVEAVDLSRAGEFLLWGVTGSGKTEVYLALIQRVLEKGRDAIVLVPEIALTPQTQRRFVARFGRSRVAVLHSGLTAAQRHAEWARCWADRDETAGGMVVVGARSAVFAPFANLGLIVIDEEHDASYKQDQSPRYLAVDVARERAARMGTGVPIVLGSATPSLERWARATRTPRATLLTLRTRATGAPMPTVKVVDLAEERRERMRRCADDPHEAARVRVLGPTLEDAMDRTLNEGGQIILLLNRRGFAHYLACPSPTCGYIVSCDACDARLVLHKGRELPAGSLIRCHHCLAERIVPNSCPVCSRRLRLWGAGTQRAEEELERTFAAYGMVAGDTLLRLDADTMSRASDYFAALDRFASGRARVLLGTQMIAKGLDFPGVRLVGVLDADTSMSMPDFRSAERTHQLVSQVAGRAGRVGAAGLVIVQTWMKDAPAVKFAATHDFEGFAKVEMAVRQRAGLPPFSRLARIVARDERETKAKDAAHAAAEAIRAASRELADAGSVRVRGPAPCVVSRIADRYRFGVEVVAKTLPDLERALDIAWNAGALRNDESMAIDVDPIHLM